MQWEKIEETELIPLWTVEDVRYWFGVERAERCWEIRVNPYQGISARARTSTVQRYDRGEWHVYEQTYMGTNLLEMHLDAQWAVN